MSHHNVLFHITNIKEFNQSLHKNDWNKNKQTNEQMDNLPNLAENKYHL